MSSNNDLLLEIQKIERASKVVLPFTALGLLGVIAAIILSAHKLNSMRTAQNELTENLKTIGGQIQEANKKLEDAQAKLKDAEGKLLSIQSQVETLQISVAAIPNAHSTKGNGSSAVDDALNQATAIDAAISAASAALTSPAGAPSPSVYGSVSVDLFYCPDSHGINKMHASRAFSALQVAGNGRWRLRILSPEVNARGSYQITNNVVRFNPDERAIANQLKADILKVAATELGQQEIDYPTPKYVSVFFCSSQ